MRIDALLELSVPLSGLNCTSGGWEVGCGGWWGGPSFLSQSFDDVQDVQMFPSAKPCLGPFSVSSEDGISAVYAAWENEVFF